MTISNRFPWALLQHNMRCTYQLLLLNVLIFIFKMCDHPIESRLHHTQFVLTLPIAITNGHCVRVLPSVMIFADVDPSTVSTTFWHGYPGLRFYPHSAVIVVVHDPFFGFVIGTLHASHYHCGQYLCNKNSWEETLTTVK